MERLPHSMTEAECNDMEHGSRCWLKDCCERPDRRGQCDWLQDRHQHPQWQHLHLCNGAGRREHIAVPSAILKKLPWQWIPRHRTRRIQQQNLCQVAVNSMVVDQHSLPHDSVTFGSREVSSLAFGLTDCFGKTVDTKGHHISFSILLLEDD